MRSDKSLLFVSGRVDTLEGNSLAPTGDPWVRGLYFFIYSVYTKQYTLEIWPAVSQPFVVPELPWLGPPVP